MNVAVSILSADFTNAWAELNDIEKYLNYIHMDIMDGVFVPNISFGPAVVKNFRAKTNLPFDTHLMIINPLKYIEKFVQAGSNMISFHLEADDNPMEVINLIHSYGVKAGIAIKPGTSVDELIKYLPHLDYVLVMSVEPGFGGQSFMPLALEKISKLKTLREEMKLDYLISVDGGINEETGKLVVDAGVDFSVVGSYLLDKVNPPKKMEILKNI